jgi:hypothetical protein
MSLDARDVALLKKLWAAGQSAAQIARRLGCSRNAVCGRLTRLGLKYSSLEDIIGKAKIVAPPQHDGFFQQSRISISG